MWRQADDLQFRQHFIHHAGLAQIVHRRIDPQIHRSRQSGHHGGCLLQHQAAQRANQAARFGNAGHFGGRHRLSAIGLPARQRFQRHHRAGFKIDQRLIGNIDIASTQCRSHARFHPGVARRQQLQVRREQADMAAGMALGRQQRQIGSAQQVFAYLPVVGAHRHANGGPHLNFGITEPCWLIHRIDQYAGQRQCAFDIIRFGQDCELITAHAAGKQAGISSAQPEPDPCDDAVAHGMPITIVHLLEAIQIDDHQGKVAAFKEALIQFFHEGASVGQAGNRAATDLAVQFGNGIVLAGAVAHHRYPAPAGNRLAFQIDHAIVVQVQGGIERLAQVHQRRGMAEEFGAVGGRGLQVGRIGQQFGERGGISRIERLHPQQRHRAAVHGHHPRVGIQDGDGLAECLDGGVQALPLRRLRFACQQQFGVGGVTTAGHRNAQ